MSTPNQASGPQLGMALPPCLVCGNETTSLEFDRREPSRALRIRTYGGYGSAVFDAMYVERLELCICDSCLLDAASLGRVQISDEVPSERTYRRWSPDEDGGV